MIEFLYDDNIISKIKQVKSNLPNEISDIFINNFSVLFLESKLTFNYFALGIREVINKYLNKSIDKNKLKECDWFPEYKKHPEKPEHITTQQKLAYIIIGNHDMESLFSLFEINDSIENIYKLIRNMNKYVHLGDKILSQTEIREHVNEILTDTINFFEILGKVKSEINLLIEITNEGVLDDVLNRTIQELDEVATHYYDEEVIIDNIKIESLLEQTEDKKKISLVSNGEISAKAQYGSDGDQRRDMGMTKTVTFPLEANIVVTYMIEGNSWDVMDVDIIDLNVDNSEWFE